MSDWIVISLICLSVYRMTRFITSDKLAEPAVIPIQSWAEKRWHRKHPGAPESDELQSMLAYFLQCSWCTSIYVAGFTVCIVDVWFASVPMPVLTALTASGVTGLLSTYEQRGDE